MGEIADMMLEGTLCQTCGEYIDDDIGGFPRTCAGCDASDMLLRDAPEPPKKKLTEAQRAKRREKRRRYRQRKRARKESTS